MSAPTIWTFFYGSYINFEVLKEVDLAPEHYRQSGACLQFPGLVY